MSITCEIAAPFVANSAVDGVDVVRPLRRHTSTCLKCQARHAAMSKTARALTSMAEETTSAPSDLEWRVMSSLQGDLAIAKSMRRPAAIIATAASMVVALIIWRLRPDAS